MSDQVGGMRRCKSWKTDYCSPVGAGICHPRQSEHNRGHRRALVRAQDSHVLDVLSSYKSTTAVYCDGGCTKCTWGLVLAKEYCCGVLEVILIVVQSCPRMSWCFGPVLFYFVLYAARYLYVYI